MDAPHPIDNGDRYRLRYTAESMGAAAEGLLPAMEAACPPGCYPLHVAMRKDPKGSRTQVTIVFQVAGRPLPIRDRGRWGPPAQ